MWRIPAAQRVRKTRICVHAGLQYITEPMNCEALPLAVPCDSAPSKQRKANPFSTKRKPHCPACFSRSNATTNQAPPVIDACPCRQSAACSQHSGIEPRQRTCNCGHAAGSLLRSSQNTGQPCAGPTSAARLRTVLTNPNTTLHWRSLAALVFRVASALEPEAGPRHPRVDERPRRPELI